jgi:2-keto-4-pentenoate hydratase
VIQVAAQVLLDRLRLAQPGPRLAPELRPSSLAQAWQLHQTVNQLRGSPVLGWKCALPRDDRWIAAAIHEVTACDGTVKAQNGESGVGRIEPELAFRLGKDLPVRDEAYGPEEVRAAIDSMHLAIEVLGCRYVNPTDASGPELMADGMWHQGLVLGPAVVNGPIELQFPITVRVCGRVTDVLPGSHPDTDPHKPLFWLAEFLREQGVGLKAGQIIITGSLAGAIELPFGVFTTLQYATYGEIGLTLLPL